MARKLLPRKRKSSYSKYYYEWLPDTRIFRSGKVLKIGGFMLGFVGYTQEQGGGHGAYLLLPGLKELVGVYPDEDKARLKVESAVEYWFSKVIG